MGLEPVPLGNPRNKKTFRHSTFFRFLARGMGCKIVPSREPQKQRKSLQVAPETKKTACYRLICRLQYKETTLLCDSSIQ